MHKKILHIGVVEKDGKVLMRKKPLGSEPYKETWYVFGGAVEDDNIDQPLIDIIKKQTGISVSVQKRIGWDTEIKKDHDGEEKLFIYLDSLCEYLEGEIKVGEGLEKVGWIPIDQLNQYDIVPPSVTLFKRLGYLE